MSFDPVDRNTQQMDTMASVIEVQELGKAYHLFERPSDRLWYSLFPHRRHDRREFRALQDVSFEVARGETLGIVGRNGSGKSTLLQIIAGTMTPSEGRVRVKGKVAALLELGSGFNPEFTGRENVYLNAAILGLSKAEVDAKFDAIVAFADIGEFIDQPVRSYSSGMVMRLAFAVMVHVDADVLIIDEALSVGDAFFTQKCMRFLRDFQSRGTLLFVSHDAGAVVGLCSRAIWLDHGQVAMTGAAQDVMEAYLATQHAAARKELSGDQVALRGQAKAGRRALQADVRQQQRRQLGLANAMRVFEFDPEATGLQYGSANAQIESVRIADEAGNTLNVLEGGEVVTLEFSTRVERDLDGLIFGFYVKDRLGQRLFGDNTFLTYLDRPISGAEGEQFHVRFSFRMPILPAGAYVVDVAVASGTQDDHTQQHWIHDAIEFHATDATMRCGLVGIPMLDIAVTKAGSA